MDSGRLPEEPPPPTGVHEAGSDEDEEDEAVKGWIKSDLPRLLKEHRSSRADRSGSVQQAEEAERPPHPRWKPNDKQLEVMDNWYNIQGAPTDKNFAEVAAQVRAHGDVQDSKINNWFQNKRTRDKKRQRKQLARKRQQTAAGGSGGGSSSVEPHQLCSPEGVLVHMEYEQTLAGAQQYPFLGGGANASNLHRVGRVGSSSQSLTALGYENEAKSVLDCNTGDHLSTYIQSTSGQQGSLPDTRRFSLLVPVVPQVEEHYHYAPPATQASSRGRGGEEQLQIPKQEADDELKDPWKV